MMIVVQTAIVNAVCFLCGGRRKYMNSLRTQRLGWSIGICCLIVLLGACSSATITSGGPGSGPRVGTTRLTLHGTSVGDNMYAVAWSPDGTRIAYGGANALVYVWNRMTKKLEYVLQKLLGSI
jgi:WD40 repeat protein